MKFNVLRSRVSNAKEKLLSKFFEFVTRSVTSFYITRFYYLYFVNWESHFPNEYIKEVWYNCSKHRSAHLFMTEIRSHSHIKRKQPQIIFLQYICSATMINIVKKCLWKKIHEQNILSRRSDDSQSLAQNKYIVKKCQLQNNYLWLLPLIR